MKISLRELVKNKLTFEFKFSYALGDIYSHKDDKYIPTEVVGS